MIEVLLIVLLVILLAGTGPRYPYSFSGGYPIFWIILIVLCVAILFRLVNV